MTTITEQGGRQNIFAKEPEMQVMDVSVTHNEIAEKLNGRLAMLGFTTGLISYVVTGNFFFFGILGQSNDQINFS